MTLSKTQLLTISGFRPEIAAALGPALGAIHFKDSPTPETAIAEAGTFVKAANGSDLHISGDFSMPADNRLQYDGDVPIRAIALASISYQCASNNQNLGFVFAKNGTVNIASQTRRQIATGADAGSSTLLDHPTLQPGDYMEVWLTNNTSTGAVTITHCHLVVLGFYP